LRNNALYFIVLGAREGKLFIFAAANFLTGLLTISQPVTISTVFSRINAEPFDTLKYDGLYIEN